MKFLKHACTVFKDKIIGIYIVYEYMCIMIPLFQQLPRDILHIILAYDGTIKYRKGEYVNQLSPWDSIFGDESQRAIHGKKGCASASSAQEVCNTC